MLIFCHLLVGLALGFILAALLKNRYAVLFGGFGAILPDLIDKPLGHLILSETVGYGRIYAHSLIFVAALFLLGLILVLSNREKVAVLCIAAGTVSHQLLDFLWTQTDVWFWPFQGGFIPVQSFGFIVDTYLPIVVLIVIECVVFACLYAVLARKKNPVQKLFYATLFLIFGLVSVYGLKLFIAGVPDFSNDSYMLPMLMKELTSYSEWICGAASLLILIDVLFLQQKKRSVPEWTMSFSAGVVSLVCAACGLCMLLAALPLEPGYGTSLGLVAMLCMGISGLILLSSTVRCFSSINSEKICRKE